MTGDLKTGTSPSSPLPLLFPLQPHRLTHRILGYLLRAKPRTQFVAQLCGAIVATFLTVGLFILFTTASPCIITGETPCPYGAPSVAAWYAVAVAVSAPKLRTSSPFSCIVSLITLPTYRKPVAIPPSSGYTAIGLAIFSVLQLIVRTYWIPKKYWKYLPNWNAIGLAFVVPQTFYSIAMCVFY